MVAEELELGMGGSLAKVKAARVEATMSTTSAKLKGFGHWPLGQQRIRCERLVVWPCGMDLPMCVCEQDPGENQAWVSGVEFGGLVEFVFLARPPNLVYGSCSGSTGVGRLVCLFRWAKLFSEAKKRNRPHS
ncbi:hypothetical protein SETIT_7G012700v2 [Setaria italica]|uniref:Uncharacterized protein n=1 Tax=Setaria italica TaxID=4555 RepID=A0A368RQT9_SETIT|nr:hypothetical protein SETIT_7G012700v2 [Setaria italica]